jgi:hypothetical protein
MSIETQKARLTKKQRDIVSNFLELFTDAEAALKKRLHVAADDSDRTAQTAPEDMRVSGVC